MLSRLLLATCLIFTGIQAAPTQPLHNQPQIAFQALISQDVDKAFVESLRSQHAWIDLRLQEHIESLPEARRIRFQDKAGELHDYVITEGEKSLLALAGIQYSDVTEQPAIDTVPATLEQANAFPTTLSHVGKLGHLFGNISLSRMQTRLEEFSGFRTRYYRSAEGKRSQAWLLRTIQDIVAASSRTDVTVTEFEHSWGQNSM